MASAVVATGEAAVATTEREQVPHVMGAATGLVLAVVDVRDRSLPAALTETAAPFHDDAAVAGRDRFRATHSGVNPKSAVK
jgi:hypothetical protein